MSRLAKVNLKHFAIVAVALVSTGLGIGSRMLVNRPQPRIVLPGTIAYLNLEGMLLPPQDTLASAPSTQLSPFNMLQRSVLASRGLLSLAGYDARMFRDVLATHTIELRSDDEELTNVELASKAIDGKVVAPADIFSFNSVVGVRSEERGFRPGLMFSQGQVVTGIGGGVCIVSTAIYNAAVNAGYQILERSPHSGSVRYAEPGLDAAVVYGCLDLQFKNNTASPLLIRSSIADGKLTVTLLGRKQKGMSVEIAREGYIELPYKVFTKEDPTIADGTVKVEAPARAGFEVTLVRIIRMNGKIVKHEVLGRDHVAPRNKVVLLPPGKPQQIAQPSETEPAESTPAPTEPSATQEKLSEPATSSDPPTWTLPTCPPEPDFDVKLGVK